ncbi:MAG: DUF11 domain-containing protein, partial [Planctomycetales bacterium]|nr:DUF11 domain-containing protein [Planctomycetales bacterium]
YSAIGAGPIGSGAIGSGAIGVQAGGTAAAPPSQPNYASSPRSATPAAAPSYLTDAAPSRTTAEPAAAAGAVAAASAATTMLAASETATSDTPGARQLEGSQAPSVTIEKRAPAEIQVGKTAVFETIVRNIGQVGAANVVVLDQIPKGAEYIEASPQPNQLPDGSLIWQLGTLAPGEAKKVTLQLQPKQEGEIGSVAQVLFAAQAGVRTICTKPELVVEHSGPQKVLVGQRVEFAITVANPGTGVATGVLIQEDVPAGLRHPAGTQLEYEIGSLRPQETKRLELTLIADKPGVIRNVMRVQGDGDLAAQHEIELEVVAPSLQVAMAGPTRRYLERQAQYSVSVANPGTAAARNVQLIVHLPKGMKFVTTDHQGQYDPRTHAVYWSLEELPAGENGVVQLTTLPIEAGDQELRVEGRAESGLQHAIAKAVQVEGLAELTFTVADVASPIEVGSDTTYVIRVQNNGSKTDTQVRVAAEFPAGLKPLAGEGPSAATVEGQVVYFEPLAQLTPKSETIFKISARGVAAGDQLVRVQVQSDEVGTPVTKEEHTRVYQDE